jgi:hypothetical protein
MTEIRNHFGLYKGTSHRIIRCATSISQPYHRCREPIGLFRKVKPVFYLGASGPRHQHYDLASPQSEAKHHWTAALRVVSMYGVGSRVLVWLLPPNLSDPPRHCVLLGQSSIDVPANVPTMIIPHKQGQSTTTCPPCGSIFKDHVGLIRSDPREF